MVFYYIRQASIHHPQKTNRHAISPLAYPLSQPEELPPSVLSSDSSEDTEPEPPTPEPEPLEYPLPFSVRLEAVRTVCDVCFTRRWMVLLIPDDFSPDTNHVLLSSAQIITLLLAPSGQSEQPGNGGRAGRNHCASGRGRGSRHTVAAEGIFCTQLSA